MADGQVSYENEGDLCFVCGTALVSLQHKAVKDELIRIITEADPTTLTPVQNHTRDLFRSICQRIHPVTGAIDFAPAFPESVQATSSTQLELYFKVAAVPLASWEQHVNLTNDKAKLVVDTAIGFDGNAMDVVVMQRSTVPPTLPYFLAKLKASDGTALHKTLLSTEQLLYAGHAANCWRHTSGVSNQKRTPGLQAANVLCNVPEYGKLRETCREASAKEEERLKIMRIFCGNGCGRFLSAASA